MSYPMDDLGVVITGASSGEVPLEAHRRVIEANLLGYVRPCRAAALHRAGAGGS